VRPLEPPNRAVSGLAPVTSSAFIKERLDAINRELTRVSKVCAMRVYLGGDHAGYELSRPSSST